MLRLMKKNAFYFAYYAAVIFPLLALYLYFVRKELSGPIIMFQGLWLILVVEGGLAVSEKAEEKTSGYEFLKILPVKDKEIVRSKFLVVLFTAIFLVAFNYTLYFFIPGAEYLYAIGRMFVPISAVYALVLAGVSYIIIFRFGHAAFVKFVWVVMIITMVGPVLFFESIILKLDWDIVWITEKMNQYRWLFWIVIPSSGLAVFYVLYRSAIGAKVKAKG